MYLHRFEATVKRSILLLIATGLNATITQGPLNSVAEIGREVKLECKADAPIGYWVLSKNGDISGELTIVGPGCSALEPSFVDHYVVELLDGGKTCNLIVSNITIEQAGVYRCLQGPSESYSILTIIESSVITVNSTTSIVEHESVVIACTLNHNGSVIPAPTLQPYFYWTDSIGQNISSFYDSTTNNTAVSQLRVIAGRQNITAYTCHVYLQLIPTAKPNYASNTPAVSSSSSSSAIEVLYFPGNINITSSVSAEYNCVYKQESLTCTADANPPAQYEWLDLTSNNVTSGSVKSITSGGRYQCTAYNDIRNQRHNETKTATETSCSMPPTTLSTTRSTTSTITVLAWETSTTSSVSTSAFPVTATTTSGSTLNNIVAIVMGVLFGISLAVNLTILIIWICKYFRAKKGKDNVPEPEMRYEEIRRPAEANMQQATYEELRQTPPLYVNQLPKNQNQTT